MEFWPRCCGANEGSNGPATVQRLFSDARCNGVYVTPLHEASDNGRLEVVWVPHLHYPRLAVAAKFPREDADKKIKWGKYGARCLGGEVRLFEVFTGFLSTS